jgi:hypothetical protein
MPFINSSIVKTAIFTAAFSLAATCANAGTFRVNVPVEARWGGATLPPGEYTIHCDPGGFVMGVSGAGKNVTILVGSTVTNPSSATSHLRITDVAGVPTVTELTSAVTGETYIFPLSKTAKKEIAQAQRRADAVASNLNAHSPVGMR